VANIKSQIKRIKTNEKARLRNKSVRSSLRTSVRKFRDSLTAGDVKAINTELRSASQALDVAVAKGVIHSNQAANKKSSMAKAATSAASKTSVK
jgi:small subunit ribosomal protein S20